MTNEMVPLFDTRKTAIACVVHSPKKNGRTQKRVFLNESRVQLNEIEENPLFFVVDVDIRSHRDTIRTFRRKQNEHGCVKTKPLLESTLISADKEKKIWTPSISTPF